MFKICGKIKRQVKVYTENGWHQERIAQNNSGEKQLAPHVAIYIVRLWTCIGLVREEG